MFGGLHCVDWVSEFVVVRVVAIVICHLVTVEIAYCSTIF